VAAPFEVVNMSDPMTKLSVRDLRVHFLSPAGPVRAVDGVSFHLAVSEALAIVGESGSGKTSIARALLGLHPTRFVKGSVQLDGREISGYSEAEWRGIRWCHIALGAQGAGVAFDPVYRIGEQIAEPIREHLQLRPEQVQPRVESLARQVGLETRHLQAYPHQLSGGEKQRAMLAMALSCNPEVLILDEPTSGQDVLSRAEIVGLLRRLRSEMGLSLLLISHDLAAVAQLADRVAVLYAGKLIEVGRCADLIETPRHPYSWGLINAYPNMTTARDLRGIRGELPDPVRPPTGCRFHPRCTQAIERCRQVDPPLVEVNGRLIACHLGGLQTLLKARDLLKTYSLNGMRGPKIDAVRRASLDIREGEVVALVGETGSGKSTLARLLVALEQRDGGHVEFQGQDLFAVDGERVRRLRQRIQYIAQDPFEVLSPRLTVVEIVREPLDIQRLGTPAERDAKAREVLCAVGLPTTADFLGRRTYELSSGQLQRVSIARALVLDPKLIIADEPVSMLDASEQAKVVNLLKDIQNERGTGLLLIAHDLALVRKVADRILVMRRGEIVEGGPASRIVTLPQNEYTRALLHAAPRFFETGEWVDLATRTPGQEKPGSFASWRVRGKY